MDGNLSLWRRSVEELGDGWVYGFRCEVVRMRQLFRRTWTVAIRPVHTPFEGDTIFALSTGRIPVGEIPSRTLTALGAIAADTLTRAIGRALWEAKPVGQWPFIGWLVDYFQDQRTGGKLPAMPRNVALPFVMGSKDEYPPLAGPYGAMLGMRYDPVYTDFTEATMRDQSVMELVPLVEMEAVQGQAPHSAYLDVYLEGGEVLKEKTDIVTGHPDNPMGWDDLLVKFQGLVEPVLGAKKTEELYQVLRNFDKPGSLAKMTALVGAK